MQFTQNIRPICLPEPSRRFTSNSATVIGWGSLRESKKMIPNTHPIPLVINNVSLNPVRWTTTGETARGHHQGVEQPRVRCQVRCICPWWHYRVDAVRWNFESRLVQRKFKKFYRKKENILNNLRLLRLKFDSGDYD